MKQSANTITKCIESFHIKVMGGSAVPEDWIPFFFSLFLYLIPPFSWWKTISRNKEKYFGSDRESYWRNSWTFTVSRPSTIARNCGTWIECQVLPNPLSPSFTSLIRGNLVPPSTEDKPCRVSFLSICMEQWLRCESVIDNIYLFNFCT